MNIVKVMGGLGNQLFQYAFGQSLIANGHDVSYDISWYDKVKKEQPRPFHLNKFEICGCTKYTNFKPVNHVTKEAGFDLQYLNMQNQNFFGYWQCLPYFEKILPQLRSELVLKQDLYTTEYTWISNAIKAADNSIAVHVRRGDYLKQTDWGALPLHYYLLALTYIMGDVFIFSDDMTWCKSVFKQKYFVKNLTFVHTNDYLDFDLMQQCSNQIISNSTYSYWAAMLNANENKKIICPEHWLGEKEPDLNGLHYPTDWIKIADYVN